MSELWIEFSKDRKEKKRELFVLLSSVSTHEYLNYRTRTRTCALYNMSTPNERRFACCCALRATLLLYLYIYIYRYLRYIPIHLLTS